MLGVDWAIKFAFSIFSIDATGSKNNKSLPKSGQTQCFFYFFYLFWRRNVYHVCGTVPGFSRLLLGLSPLNRLASGTCRSLKQCKYRYFVLKTSRKKWSSIKKIFRRKKKWCSGRFRAVKLEEYFWTFPTKESENI